MSKARRQAAEHAILKLLTGYKHGDFDGQMEFQDGFLDPRTAYQGSELADAVRVNYPMFVAYKTVTFDDIYADPHGPLVVHTILRDGAQEVSATFVVDPREDLYAPYFVYGYGQDLDRPMATTFAARSLYVDPRLMVQLSAAAKS